MSDAVDKHGPRVPPHSDRSERAILGSMLVSPTTIARAEELLTADDFYKLRHQIIFTTIKELADKGEPADLITLEAALAAKNQLEEVGGVAYMTELFDVIPTAANLDHYAKIVKNKALLRRLIDVSQGISAEAYEEEDEIDAIADRAEAEIFKVTQSLATRPYHAMKEVVSETYAIIEKLYDQKANITGVPSGLTDLDKVLAGFQKSDLIILAARPSVGKTALCLTFAVNIGCYEKRPVLLFSLEMGRTQLAMRMLAMESRVDMGKLRTGFFKESDWSGLTMACGVLSESPIYIDDSPNVSLREMRSKARRIAAEHAATGGLGMIIVDYLQLMEIKDKKVESRQLEISALSRGLKQLARELQVPVLALSQLSRKLEERTDKRPMLSDLRESGAIEQDADVVLFIHREDRYKQDLADEERGVAEIIVAKQRNGPLDNVKVQFKAEHGRFRDLEQRYND